MCHAARAAHAAAARAPSRRLLLRVLRVSERSQRLPPSCPANLGAGGASKERATCPEAKLLSRVIMLARRLAAAAAAVHSRAIATSAAAAERRQGSSAPAPTADRRNPSTGGAWEHLYSPNMEQQEQVYLAADAARRAAADAERSAARGDRCECAAVEDAERRASGAEGAGGRRRQEAQLHPDFYEQFDADVSGARGRGEWGAW